MEELLLALGTGKGFSEKMAPELVLGGKQTLVTSKEEHACRKILRRSRHSRAQSLVDKYY